MLCGWGRNPARMVNHFMQSATLMSPPAHQSCTSAGSNVRVLSPCSRTGLALQAPHLSLGEAQRHRQLRLPAHGDVAVALKLLLKLQPLFVGVHHPVLVPRAGLPCWFAQKSLHLDKGNSGGNFVDGCKNEQSTVIKQQTNLEPSASTFKFWRHLKPRQLD